MKPEQRHNLDLPSTATISRDEFLEATTDLWEIPPESATRVGHPAPFPVALPQRLIELYTYEDDVVLDPFMGSGSTAVAAVRTKRHFIGFDTDDSYVKRAQARVNEEIGNLQREVALGSGAPRVFLPAVRSTEETEDLPARAVREGRQAKDLAGILLASSGFVDVQADFKLARLGIGLSFLALDQIGGQWAFDVSGAFTSNRSGLRRSDTLWKALGTAAVLREGRPELPLVLLTTDLPARASAGRVALEAMTGPGRPVFDSIELLDPKARQRLHAYALGGPAGS